RVLDHETSGSCTCGPGTPGSAAGLTDDLPFDDHAADVGRELERISVEEGDIAILAAFQGTYPPVLPNDPGGINGDRREGLLRGEAVSRGGGGFEEDHAG